MNLWSVDSQFQALCRAWKERCGKVQHPRQCEESLVQRGNADGARSSQGNISVDPVPHFFKASEDRSARARTRQEARQVPGAIADERHRATTKRSEDNLANLS